MKRKFRRILVFTFALFICTFGATSAFAATLNSYTDMHLNTSTSTVDATGYSYCSSNIYNDPACYYSQVGATIYLYDNGGYVSNTTTNTYDYHAVSSISLIYLPTDVYHAETTSWFTDSTGITTWLYTSDNTL